MGTLTTLTGSLLGVLLVVIIYGFIFVSALLSALGIFRAGTGFYKKVKNDTQMVLFNKTFDAYRDYSRLLFHYINLITEDNSFDLTSPQYKEAHQKLRLASGEIVLLADHNLRTQISGFIDYSLALSNDQATVKNTDKTKQEFINHLFSLQKAIKNHLDSLKPVTDIKDVKAY